MSGAFQPVVRPRLRGRQPRGTVRGQLSGLRSRQDAAARDGFDRAAPDQVQEVCKVGSVYFGPRGEGRRFTRPTNIPPEAVARNSTLSPGRNLASRRTGFGIVIRPRVSTLTSMASAPCRSPRQRVDFRVGWKTAERCLGKFELAVNEHVENPAAGADEFNIGLTKL